jgi:hypothetical protein
MSLFSGFGGCGLCVCPCWKSSDSRCLSIDVLQRLACCSELSHSSGSDLCRWFHCRPPAMPRCVYVHIKRTFMSDLILPNFPFKHLHFVGMGLLGVRVLKRATCRWRSGKLGTSSPCSVVVQRSSLPVSRLGDIVRNWIKLVYHFPLLLDMNLIAIIHNNQYFVYTFDWPLFDGLIVSPQPVALFVVCCWSLWSVSSQRQLLENEAILYSAVCSKVARFLLTNLVWMDVSGVFCNCLVQNLGN